MIVFKHPGESGTYSVIPFPPIDLSKAVPVATLGSTNGTGAPNGARIAAYQPPIHPVFGSNAVEVIIREAGAQVASPFHLVIHMII
jgi:hypothetical protein